MMYRCMLCLYPSFSAQVNKKTVCILIMMLRLFHYQRLHSIITVGAYFIVLSKVGKTRIECKRIIFEDIGVGLPGNHEYDLFMS